LGNLLALTQTWLAQSGGFKQHLLFKFKNVFATWNVLSELKKVHTPLKNVLTVCPFDLLKVKYS